MEECVVRWRVRHTQPGRYCGASRQLAAGNRATRCATMRHGNTTRPRRTHTATLHTPWPPLDAPQARVLHHGVHSAGDAGDRGPGGVEYAIEVCVPSAATIVGDVRTRAGTVVVLQHPVR